MSGKKDEKNNNPKHDYVANPVTYEDPDGNENNFFFPELEEVFPDVETSTPITSTPITSTPITNTNTYGDFLASQEKSTNDYYTKLLAQYEEQNKALIAQINKNKAEALSYAEGQKRAAEEAAKIQRERDMVDAANAYEKNKATYGTKAEALADMGLTGGGYSDHIDAQAYAAQRGDVQAAIARQTESNRLAKNAYNDAYYQINSDANKAILDAQNTTNQLKNAAEASKHSELSAIESNKATYNEGAFQSVLEGINNGTISESQIDNLAALYGMSDSQKQAWLDAANKVAKDTEKLKAEAESSYKSGIFTDILDKISTGAISADQIEKLANMYGMSDEQKQIWLDAASKYGNIETESKKGVYASNVEKIISEFKNYGTEYTDADLDRMVANDAISETDKNYVKKYYADSKKSVVDDNGRAVYNDLATLLNDGDFTNVTQAIKNLEQYKASGEISKDVYDDAMNLINNSSQGVYYQYKTGKISASKYVEKMTQMGFANSATVEGGWYLQGLGRGTTVDDIDLTIGGTSRDSANEFDLRCGDEVPESMAKILNYWATGSRTTSPSDTKKNTSSEESGGKVVCYKGKLYVYTKTGWRNVVSDGDKVEDAVVAWINASVSSNKIDLRSK